MNIKKSLLVLTISIVIATSSSGALQASCTPLLYPTPAADPVTTTTAPRTTAAKMVVWSNQKVNETREVAGDEVGVKECRPDAAVQMRQVAGRFWVSSAKFAGEAPRNCFGDGRIHLFIHFRNFVN